jgi:sensor histidine kinase regulating citrate/malate metabolism
MRHTLNPRRWSLARQLLALQTVIITVLVVGGVAGAYAQASRTSLNTARDKVLAVAYAVAADPVVAQSVQRPNPTAVLLPLADKVQADTGTDFVVVMSPTGTRYTHPNHSQIGGQFIGHLHGAKPTDPVTETFTGTLGPSMRAVVPILDGDRVLGRVSVGIRIAAVSRGVRDQVPVLFGAAAIALVLAGAGSWLVSRWLRRQTHDLGPRELARMYEFYDAVLHAVREGLLLLDRQGRLQLANDEARRLLDLPEEGLEGRPVDQVNLPEHLGRALAEGHERTDEIHLTGDRVLVVNQARARWGNTDLGTVVTLRDHTDLQALTGELDSVRGFAEALRAQAHESSNRLHTVVSLIELGRAPQALEFAAAEIAAAQELTDKVVGAVREPVLAALLLGKVTQASERGVDLVVGEDGGVPEGLLPARDLVTIVGNLLDNAIDAAVAAPPPRRVELRTGMEGETFVLRVSDSGDGLDPADVERAFRRGWSTKPDDGQIGRGLGLALVAQAVRRHGGTIDVDRSRFTVRIPASAHLVTTQ